MAVAVTGLKRRWLLVKAARGTLGFALIGVAAACSVDGDDQPCVVTGTGGDGFATGLSWWQVDLAYVSAFVLVRGREAALVDCGLPSTVDEIAAVLGAAGTGWDRVRHVLITHAHPDHAGGLNGITARAPRATFYAGAAEKARSYPTFPDADSASIWEGSRPVTDGEEVFGLQVVDTPGHTAGHIAVFDPDSRVLVAGDALTNTVGGLKGPMPDFTLDMATAEASVRKMADMEPDVILVGHGPPVQRDAAAQLRRLASST